MHPGAYLAPASVCSYIAPQLGFGSILTSSSKLVDGIHHSPAACALYVANNEFDASVDRG